MKTDKDAGRKFAKCPRIIQKCGMFTFLDDDDGIKSRNSSFPTVYPSTSSSSRKPASTKRQKCFKCNKTGHWANACPN